MSKIVSAKRNESMEVLRCFLMVMIVAWHTTVHGIYSPGQLAYNVADFSILPFLLTCWHVDGFVAISGWFGIRFRPSKFLRLFSVIVFYSLVNYVVAGLCYGGMRFTVDGGWFGGSYLMLMLLAPLLNQAIKGSCGCVGIILMLIGVTLQWSPYTRDYTGIMGYGAGAYSLFMIICIYLVSRKLSSMNFRCGSRRLILAASSFILGMVVCGGSYVALKIVTNQFVSFLDWQHFSYYNAPHVILFAVSIVSCVGSGYIHVPDWLGRMCSMLGPSMFSVYLIHDVSVYGYDLYLPLQKWLYSAYHLPSFVILSVSTVVVFFSCVALDMVRRLLLAPVNRLVESLLLFVDKKYEAIFMLVENRFRQSFKDERET